MTAEPSGPYSLGDTIWVPGRRLPRVLGVPAVPDHPGYPRTLVTQAEVIEANRAFCEGRAPRISDIRERG